MRALAVLFAVGTSTVTLGCLPSYPAGADGSEGGPVADSSGLADTGAGVDVAGDGGPDATVDAPPEGSSAFDASPFDAAAPLDSPVTPLQVGVGYSGSCALLDGGAVQCWGSNKFGGLGAGEPADAEAYVPQPVPGLSNVTALAVGSSHTCVVVEGGVVGCWGYGGEGSLGTGTIPESSPVLIQALQYSDGGAIRLLASGEQHTCAIAEDGVTLWCWGYYAGTSPTTSSTSPVYLATLPAGAVEMAAGASVTCERDVNGDVWCWGANNQGVLGQGGSLSTSAYTLTPVRVPIGTPVAQLAVGHFGACAVTTAHDLVCWGDDTLDQLGPLELPDGSTYAPAPLGLPIAPGHVVQVGCGDSHTCALFDDGGVQCWGYDDDGELGVASPPNEQEFPVSVPQLGAVTELYVHYESACARLAAGGVACWGNDDNGQLGAGPLPSIPVGAYPVSFP